MTGIPLFIIIPSDFVLLAKRGQKEYDSDDCSDSLSQSTSSLSSSASTRWMNNEVRKQEIPKATSRAPPRRPQRHCSQKSICTKDLICEGQGPQAKVDLHDSSPKLPRRSWVQTTVDFEETVVSEELPLCDPLAEQEHHCARRRKSEPASRPALIQPCRSFTAIAAAMAA